MASSSLRAHFHRFQPPPSPLSSFRTSTHRFITFRFLYVFPFALSFLSFLVISPLHAHFHQFQGISVSFLSFLRLLSQVHYIQFSLVASSLPTPSIFSPVSVTPVYTSKHTVTIFSRLYVFPFVLSFLGSLVASFSFLLHITFFFFEFTHIISRLHRLDVMASVPFPTLHTHTLFFIISTRLYLCFIVTIYFFSNLLHTSPHCLSYIQTSTSSTLAYFLSTFFCLPS